MSKGRKRRLKNNFLHKQMLEIGHTYQIRSLDADLAGILKITSEKTGKIILSIDPHEHSLLRKINVSGYAVNNLSKLSLLLGKLYGKKREFKIWECDDSDKILYINILCKPETRVASQMDFISLCTNISVSPISISYADNLDVIEKIYASTLPPRNE